MKAEFRFIHRSPLFIIVLVFISLFGSMASLLPESSAGHCNDQTPLIVGIAGGTGSGKTTFARSVVELVGKEHVTVISHDSYYKALNHLTAEERDARNFDHPDALDTALLVEDLKQLKQNKTVNIPTYDFGTHCRIFDAEHKIEARRVIILEGILIFADPSLVDLIDIKIFVDIAADVRILRRLDRDITERKRTRESVVKQYLDTVRPMHEQFVEPSKLKADLIVPGVANEVSVDLVATKIKVTCGL